MGRSDQVMSKGPSYLLSLNFTSQGPQCSQQGGRPLLEALWAPPDDEFLWVWRLQSPAASPLLEFAIITTPEAHSPSFLQILGPQLRKESLLQPRQGLGKALGMPSGWRGAREPGWVGV